MQEIKIKTLEFRQMEIQELADKLLQLNKNKFLISKIEINNKSLNADSEIKIIQTFTLICYKEEN